MARPRIEFVQCQALPWRDDPLAAIRPGIQARVLSHDPEDGACSLMLRYPAGWSLDAGQSLGCDEEILVLDGALHIGDDRLGQMGFAHLPAGHVRGALSSPQGATLLAFYSAGPRTGTGTPAPDRLVSAKDGMTLPYTGNFHPEFPPGAGRRMLYEDPVTGDQSWLLGTMGLRWAERAERHPVVEEMFLIAGEVHGNLGIMRPGAYFWRPPEVPHGPYGSLTGNIYFFRTKGGGLSTEYEDAPVPFHWWPEHKPVLPEGMPATPVAAGPQPW